MIGRRTRLEPALSSEATAIVGVTASRPRAGRPSGDPGAITERARVPPAAA
jgi:hypothetical protein